MSDIKSRLRATISKALRDKVAPEAIRGADLIAELGINSIDALEILISVEIEFGIRVEDEDLSQALLASLDTLEAYVAARLAHAG